MNSILSLFGQFGQLKKFSVKEVSSGVFAVSMKAPNIAEIEAECDVLANNFKLTMAWMESQRQVAVFGSDVNEPALPSPQQSLKMRTYTFNIFNVSKNVRPKVFFRLFNFPVFKSPNTTINTETN